MSGNSPAPGTPQTGTKAFVSTALSVLALFGMAWIADVDPFTAKEAVGAGIGALVSGGVIGVVTYKVKNKPI